VEWRASIFSPGATRPFPESPAEALAISWLSSASGPEPNGFQSMKQSYERCLALARAEAQNGNTVAAENYYQHAEHFYRLMFTDLKHKWEL